MISECLCLPEAVEVSKEVVNGSSCIVPGVSGKQVENREGTVKTEWLHVLSLPSFCLVRMITSLWIWIPCEYINLFLWCFSADPFIQQAASGISDPSSVCSCTLMTEVKSTCLEGRKYKVHGLNERCVIQRCVPPCYLTGAILPPAVHPHSQHEPHSLQAQQPLCADGPTVLSTLTEQLQSHLNGRSDGKPDCRNFQPMGTSAPCAWELLLCGGNRKAFSFQTNCKNQASSSADVSVHTPWPKCAGWIFWILYSW